MQNSIQSLIAFVAVGKTGAFVRAAEQLGVSPSVVSHHIAKLEDLLGETLVHRTTRKLTLSENGKRLFDAAQSGLQQIELALEEVQSDDNEVVGALRIALPAFVPDPRLEARIMEFATYHQNVALTLDYSDQIVDLVGGAFDLAIRLGELPSSSLVQRRVGTVDHVLVSTPDYLLQYGTPGKPEDLSALPVISMSRAFDQVTLSKGKVSQTITLASSRMKVTNIHGALTAARAGLGFAELPRALAKEDLVSGRLVQLLPDWRLPPVAVQAVWSGTSHRRALARRFVDWLTR